MLGDGFISIYDTYIKIVFYDITIIEDLLKYEKFYYIKWCYMSHKFVNYKKIPKMIKIYINNFNSNKWKSTFFFGEYNIFYEIEQQYVIKYVYGINNINTHFFKKMQWTMIDMAGELIQKPYLYIYGCFVIHNIENIKIIFLKKDSHVAIQLCRYKSNTGWTYDSYKYIYIKYDQIFIDIINYSNFEILKYISEIGYNEYIEIIFSLNDVENHNDLYNVVVVPHDKYILEHDMLRYILS